MLSESWGGLGLIHQEIHALQARDVDVAAVYAKDVGYDSLSPGISPRTPLEFCRDGGRAASPPTPMSNSETSRSMQAWWVALLPDNAVLPEANLASRRRCGSCNGVFVRQAAICKFPSSFKQSKC